MSFDELVSHWEKATGLTFGMLNPSFTAFSRARWELEAAMGEPCAPLGYKDDLNWQLEYWKYWFKLSRDFAPKATAICVQQIQRLRGRGGI